MPKASRRWPICGCGRRDPQAYRGICAIRLAKEAADRDKPAEAKTKAKPKKKKIN